jgi:outer membrane protein
MKSLLFFLFLALANSTFAMDDVPDGLPDHIVGDIGAAVYTSNLHIGTEGTQSLALPYAFFDYKRFFARIDEGGIKT